jgi:LDH2 family malate/lactate/ureidoglycolate dehydrogenase
MIPIAGHKGYGIAMLIEVLAGALTGAGMLREVKSWILQPTEDSKLGQAFIAIHIENLLPIESFRRRIDNAIAELRGAPKAKGSERIYVPGEIEWEKRADALVNGIPLPELVFASLYRTGQQLGIPTDLLD